MAHSLAGPQCPVQSGTAASGPPCTSTPGHYGDYQAKARNRLFGFKIDGRRPTLFRSDIERYILSFLQGIQSGALAPSPDGAACWPSIHRGPRAWKGR